MAGRYFHINIETRDYTKAEAEKAYAELELLRRAAQLEQLIHEVDNLRREEHH